MPASNRSLFIAFCTAVTIFALMLVALSIGYHEYDRAFWASTGWLACAGFNYTRGRI